VLLLPYNVVTVTTTGIARPNATLHTQVHALEPEPPAWVRALFDDSKAPIARERHGDVDIVRRDSLTRITTRIPAAAALTAADLSEQVMRRYTAIMALLPALASDPIRFWNYVPGIVDAVESGMDRYMAFNRGRFAAYAAHRGNVERFGRVLPAASAVGITGRDLVVDCLASATAGTPLENPRQISSWRYSRRYGPKPPCFARGTMTTLNGRRVLLLGGTASIVGEESRHPGDLDAQVREVLTNMTALIGRAVGSEREALDRLTDLRIYVVHAEHAGIVEGAIREACPRAMRVETVVARVCRPELLVEVEGVANV
jgi:chorismate lyase / 3-hydroxybenzoate synthase